MAHDGQTRRARQHHADLPTFPRPGAEPGRERLAVPPPELALKHRLRKLRRDRRRRMHRLAKAHRSTRNHHLHRNARLGSRRSDAMTLNSVADTPKFLLKMDDRRIRTRSWASTGCALLFAGRSSNWSRPGRAISRLPEGFVEGVAGSADGSDGV